MTAKFSPGAREDLSNIWLRIAQDKDPETADRVYSKIMADVARLCRTPEIGHRRADLTERDVLFWKIFNHLIVYRRSPESLDVVRVLHGARDAKNILDEE